MLFLFVLVVDVVTEFVSDDALSELLCGDDLVLMSERIERLRDRFLKLKEAFVNKGLKVKV